MKNISRITVLTVLLCMVSAAVIVACADDGNGSDNGNGDTLHDYVCANGTAFDEQTTTEDTTKCASCNTGFVLVNEDCQPFSINITLNGDAIQTGVTIAATASHDALLHWIVYTGDNVTKDATTVMADIADSGTAGADSSDSAGIAITAHTPLQIVVDSLTAATAYTMYAVITSGNSVTLSTALPFTTAQLGVAIFTEPPAVVTDSIQQTAATITLTADTSTDLYWVVYNSKQTTLDATQLKATAEGSVDLTAGIVSVSGSSETVDANTKKTIELTDLVPQSTYFFYAMLENNDKQTLSSFASFMTDGYNFECANGTAVDPSVEQSATEGATKCTSCNDFYKLNDSNACVPTVYTCSDGEKATGNPNETADGNATDKNTDIERCTSCDDFYKLNDSNACVPTVYTCSNGVAVTDSAPNEMDDSAATDKNADIEKCMSCDNANHSILNGACVLFGFSSAPATSGTTASGSTINVTASHDATLHWVVYAEGISKTDAATVVDDAKDDSTVVVIAKSGTTGIPLTGGVQAQFFVSSDSIAAETSYTAYVVITSVVDSSFRVLSDALNFATAVAGIPGFTAQPATSNLKQTTTDITLTADESTELYWVLASSPQTLTNDELKMATVSDNIVAVSSSTETITADEEKSIPFTGLLPETTYYFYALLEDDEDNQRASTEFKFSTIGYNFECANGTAVDPSVEQSTTEGATKCTSCNDFYKLNDSNACVPTVYTCSDGDKATGNPNETADGAATDKNADIERCTSCDDFYKLNDSNACVPTVYTCENGEGVTDSNPNETDDGAAPDKNVDIPRCASCNDFYKLNDSNACVPTVYTCSDGEKATGNPNETADGDAPDKNADIERCTSCDDFYKLNDSNACVPTVYTCSDGEKATGNPNETDDGAATDKNADIEKCISCDTGNYLTAENGLCMSGNAYVCSNGNAAYGEAPNTNSIWCTACDTGYYLDNSDLSCKPGSAFVCTNGSPANGGAMEVTNSCASCDSSYYLTEGNGSCMSGNAFTCVNGNAAYGEAPNANTNRCRSCHTGHYLDGDTLSCRSGNAFICTNGSPATGEAPDATTIKCTNCDPGYTLGSYSNSCARPFALDSINDAPSEIWSNDTTMWVLDGIDHKVYAYALADGTRDTAKEFDLDSSHSNPSGMWSDGTTVWIASGVLNNHTLYAYTLSGGVRNAAKDITLVANGVIIFGIPDFWSDGTTVWVPSDGYARAFSIADGTRVTSQDIGLADANDRARGTWSDGTTLWVADSTDDKVYAYTLATGMRDNDKEFDFDSDNDASDGIWGNGSTLWVVDHGLDKLFAYSLNDSDRGDRDETNEFDIDSTNGDSEGAWSNGITLWVIDGRKDRVFAYTLATGARDSAKDFALHTDNASPTGIWSNGTTVWIADTVEEKLFAYTLANGTREDSKEFDLFDDGSDDLYTDNFRAVAVWSNGTTIWVTNDSPNKVFAYALDGGARKESDEFNLHSDNGDPRGAWSDGTTLWVADDGDDKVFAYTLDGGARDENKEFDLDDDNGNSVPSGIWSNDLTFWVTDIATDAVFVY